MATTKLSIGEFVYAGDSSTLGSRWESWVKRFLRYKAASKYGLCAVNGAPRRNEGALSTVIINGSKISLLVDTGSPFNVLDEKTFKSLVSKPVLEKCNTRYCGFTAKQPLPILGQFTARIECKDKSASAGFIVIQGDAECLMSYVTAKARGVISLNI